MIDMQAFLEVTTRDSISRVLSTGAEKPRPCEWWEESQDMHIAKAARHLMTYQLMRDGHQENNGENHLELALTRVAMAMVMDKIGTN